MSISELFTIQRYLNPHWNLEQTENFEVIHPHINKEIFLLKSMTLELASSLFALILSWSLCAFSNSIPEIKINHYNYLNNLNETIPSL